MKSILVTGGLGYIGSHTVVELLDAGYSVHIVDNLANSESFIFDRIKKISSGPLEFTQLDLRDKSKVVSFFSSNKFDAVIHFAAAKAVGESVEKPLYYFENNVSAFVNLLFAMNDNGVNSLVFSSSCTVYGNPDRLPVTEKSPRKQATNPYGLTKQMCEDILESCGIKGIALRYFNPVGAHSSGLIGELPRGVPSNLVPFVCQTATGLRPELSVFGNDYDTPDGSAIRDYIHVVDLARAHVSALHRLFTADISCEFFNIGTGQGHSVLEVVKTFEEVNGVLVPHRIVGRRAGDVPAIYADCTLAKRVLHWSAQHDLKDMLTSAWNFQKLISKDHQ